MTRKRFRKRYKKKKCNNKRRKNRKSKKIDRLKGIQESDMRENKSPKFFIVGLITKKRGGNSHSSLAGFSDVEIV